LSLSIKLACNTASPNAFDDILNEVCEEAGCEREESEEED
jgi:hypothetical protein